MIGAVAARTMAMGPSVVSRQQPIDHLHQVLVAPRTQLHDYHARRCVRDEDVQQAILPSRHLLEKSGAGIG